MSDACLNPCVHFLARGRDGHPIYHGRREVTTEEAERLARDHELSYLEISAKEGRNVEKVRGITAPRGPRLPQASEGCMRGFVAPLLLWLVLVLKLYHVPFTMPRRS